jgi:phospholipid-translocating ATPase
MSLVLFENEFLNIVAISFTALVINELIMVALEITTWYVTCFATTYPLLTYLCRHIYMVISEIATLLFYVISIAFLPEYFGTFSFGGSRMPIPCLLALQISHSWSPYDSCGS